MEGSEMMTRKDFESIAQVVNKLPLSFHDTLLVARALIPVLKEGNPAFQAERFEAACMKER